jgi:hypothetical protein
MIVGFVCFTLRCHNPRTWGYSALQVVAQLGMFNNLLPTRPQHLARALLVSSAMLSSNRLPPDALPRHGAGRPASWWLRGPALLRVPRARH